MRRCLLVALLAVLQATPAPAAEDADVVRGLKYARATCAKCHSVEADGAASPVAEAPPFKMVAAMPSMTGRALTVWLQSPHPTMPMLMVPDAERNNLIAYILSLKGGT